MPPLGDSVVDVHCPISYDFMQDAIVVHGMKTFVLALAASNN